MEQSTAGQNCYYHYPAEYDTYSVVPMYAKPLANRGVRSVTFVATHLFGDLSDHVKHEE